MPGVEYPFAHRAESRPDAELPMRLNQKKAIFRAMTPRPDRRE